MSDHQWHLLAMLLISISSILLWIAAMLAHIIRQPGLKNLFQIAATTAMLFASIEGWLSI